MGSTLSIRMEIFASVFDLCDYDVDWTLTTSYGIGMDSDCNSDGVEFECPGNVWFLFVNESWGRVSGVV
jgi:hypothetical protein